MQNELSKQEIKKIINALLKFIVLDGKAYINEENRELYNLHYLQILTQITNNEIPVNEKDYLIIENILKDINTTISDK